jgi:hypothetical protein
MDCVVLVDVLGTAIVRELTFLQCFVVGHIYRVRLVLSIPKVATFLSLGSGILGSTIRRSVGHFHLLHSLSLTHLSRDYQYLYLNSKFLALKTKLYVAFNSIVISLMRR